MKIAYKMFHLGNNPDREGCLESAHKAFAAIDEFDTPTISIFNKEELVEFLNNNKEFNLDFNGYSLDNIQGWRFGEIGIWASNLTAWRNFLKSDYDYLILMEDDLRCEPLLLDNIKKYIREAPQYFDAFHMFCPNDQVPKYHSGLDVSENICHAFQDWSSACYVIQKNTISNMINLADKGIYLPLDWFMFRQQNIFNVYTLKPDLDRYCKTLQIESTFQTKQDRILLNGIF